MAGKRAASVLRHRAWSELSRGQQRAVIVAGAAQLAFQAAALVDLARRPAREVNGDKRLWAAATFVNWVGPLAYFVRGRRR